MRTLRLFSASTVLLTVLCMSIDARADYDIEHLEPAFWWTGMRNNNLQLLVHGEAIAELSPAIDYPGVTIEKVHTVENPNYLFVDILLADTVAPGNFTINFTKNDVQQLSYEYQLLEREPKSAERKGFGPDDVIYLITPDRFANGDVTNDQVASLKEGLDRSDKFGRHGGDLQGIIEHLDYISDMGFTQIWLNPVLENNQPEQSYHGYATTDFYKVDARFGTNQQYRKLSAEAAKKGVGLVMDMIPNHSGSEHWWMQDLPSEDWINHGGEFVPTSHKRESLRDPHGVKADRKAFADGWFVPTMPDLNQRNPFMATYLIQNSIWWIEYAGLSGIRVDTYSYSDREFLTEWTQRLGEEYPNFSMVGEEWSLNPAIVAYWQRGKTNRDGYVSYLPSLMDFPLQNAVVQGLMSEETWGSGLTEIYEMLANDFLYADPDNLVVFPDNHDMDRIYTQLDEQYDLYKMAMAYFLTTRGIPQIYYGTEILMSNAAPGDHGIIRTDFPGGWPTDKVNAFTGEGLAAKQQDAKAFMHRLLNWRKSAVAIHKGKLTHYAPEDGVYVYFRHHKDGKVMVVLNKNDQPTRLPTDRFRQFLGDRTIGADVLTGKKYNLGEPITLEPVSALVLDINTRS
jgi:glycosidase